MASGSSSARLCLVVLKDGTAAAAVAAPCTSGPLCLPNVASSVELSSDLVGAPVAGTARSASAVLARLMSSAGTAVPELACGSWSDRGASARRLAMSKKSFFST